MVRLAFIARAVGAFATLTAVACLPQHSASSAVSGAANAQSAHVAECRWPAAPQVLHRAADTVYLAWGPQAELPLTWRPRDVPALIEFQQNARTTLVHAGLSPDPRVLLQRQAQYWVSRPTPVERLEAANGEAVLAGNAGVLRPMGCLEALLLEAQLEQFPATAARSEMHAFVLTRTQGVADADNPRQLVYFAASSAPFPPSAGLLLDLITAREPEGWHLAADLHNHPFYFDHLGARPQDQPSGDIAGANAPSTSDVQFYRFLRARLGLEQAWLTNGFSTLVLPASALEHLYDRSDTASAPPRPVRGP